MPSSCYSPRSRVLSLLRSHDREGHSAEKRRDSRLHSADILDFTDHISRFRQPHPHLLLELLAAALLFRRCSDCSCCVVREFGRKVTRTRSISSPDGSQSPSWPPTLLPKRWCALWAMRSSLSQTRKIRFHTSK